MRAVVDGTAVSVGTLEWVTRNRARSEWTDAAQQAATFSDSSPARNNPQQSLQQHQHQHLSRLTRVYVGIDDSVAAYIDVTDDLRYGAAATIAGLRRMGITSMLLSGAPRTS